MNFDKHYVDSLIYEIELLSRVCHETFKRWFDKNTIGDLTVDEFVVLDTLDLGHNLSQIELANTMLKGKAHTGKFLDSLEAKGMITRLYDTKNSRMVKIPIMTEKGKQVYDELRLKIDAYSSKLNKMYPETKIKNLQIELKKFRESITKMENISFN